MHEPLLVFLPPFPCPFVVCKGLFVAAAYLHVSFFLINAHVQNVAWTTNHNGSTVIYAVHLS